MFYRYRLVILISTALFIVSCAGSSKYMIPTQSFLKPSEDKALVRFMRPSGFGHAINFNMLDGKKVIGNSVAKSQFDYLADPGTHLFVGISENKVFLDADLEAGKTYYVITRIYTGWLRGRVQFLPVTRNSKHWNHVKEYEKSLIKIEPDKEALEKWEEANTAKIDYLLSNYETVWKDKYDWPKLNREDGR